MKTTIAITGLMMCLALLAPIHAQNSIEQPNILFILADDLAWADLGCYGHPWHETPHLDQLAAQGMRFTNGYAAAPICSASRASILTGKSTARLGFEFVTKEHPGEQAIPGQRLVSHFYVHTPVDTRCQWLLEKYATRVPADSPNRNQRIKYGAFVETLDHYVGQLLTTLAESDHADNTLVVFTSDNGGHPEYAANGPLRGSKWNLYEGGIRVPFLVKWPHQMTAGSVNATPVIGYDLLPTFVELAGAIVDQSHHSIDGVSLVSLFRGSSELEDRNLYWHFPYYHPERGYSESLDRIGVDDFAVSKTRPQSAMRRAGHKLIYFYEDQRTELFDLTQDVSEHADLWQVGSDVAEKLRGELNSYLDRVHARRPAELAASPN